MIVKIFLFIQFDWPEMTNKENELKMVYKFDYLPTGLLSSANEVWVGHRNAGRPSFRPSVLPSGRPSVRPSDL